MVKDPLIAQTLAEAEKHRETFQTLARENDVLHADYQARKLELDNRQAETEATEDRQRNTATQQEAEGAALTERETAVKASEKQLVADREDFETKSAERSSEIDYHEKAIAGEGRDFESKRLAFESVQRRSLTESAKRESDQKEREDRLVAGEARQKADAAAFQEERANYKDKVREEVLQELRTNIK